MPHRTFRQIPASHPNLTQPTLKNGTKKQPFFSFRHSPAHPANDRLPKSPHQHTFRKPFVPSQTGRHHRPTAATVTLMDRENPAEYFPTIPVRRNKKGWYQGNRTITLFCMSRFSWGTGCGKYVTKLPNSDHNCFVEYPGEDMRCAPRVSLTSPVTLKERYTWG